jgi:hypothetical protein
MPNDAKWLPYRNCDVESPQLWTLVIQKNLKADRHQNFEWLIMSMRSRGVQKFLDIAFVGAPHIYLAEIQRFFGAFLFSGFFDSHSCPTISRIYTHSDSNDAIAFQFKIVWPQKEEPDMTALCTKFSYQ